MEVAEEDLEVEEAEAVVEALEADVMMEDTKTEVFVEVRVVADLIGAVDAAVVEEAVFEVVDPIMIVLVAEISAEGVIPMEEVVMGVLQESLAEGEAVAVLTIGLARLWVVLGTRLLSIVTFVLI